jgi:NAD+ synthase (glutamine-hydrolysing)
MDGKFVLFHGSHIASKKGCCQDKIMRIQATQINLTVGDIEGNTRKVLEGLNRARKANVDVVLFPELTLLGYPPEDLLLDGRLIDALEKKLAEIAPATAGLFVAVGVARRASHGKEKFLHNSAAIFIDGALVGFKDKALLPEYDVFDERRFFEPQMVDGPAVYPYKGHRIGVTICEDAWQHAGILEYSHYSRDPIRELSEQKIDVLLNLSASPYHRQKRDTRVTVFMKSAKTLGCPVVMCSQVGANDQIVFDGHSLYINRKGELAAQAKGFVEDDLVVDLSLETAAITAHTNEIEDLFSSLVLGVRDYFQKQNFSHAIIGLSGGIDSAMTACIAVEALGKDQVRALNLPSRYSSVSGQDDAAHLARNLGVEIQSISIDGLFQHYLDTLGAFFVGREEDITEENLQSRIRGMILMAFSNKFGAIVLTPGDKSEMAMGYITLYGDMVGGLGVLQDVTKTNVYRLAKYVNRSGELIPASILSKAPSPELKIGQTALDRLPPFEVLDPILEDYLESRLSPQEIAEKRGHSLQVVDEIIRRIHAAEYKRRQAPIGIRVTSKAFSRGRVVPIVQKWVY